MIPGDLIPEMEKLLMRFGISPDYAGGIIDTLFEWGAIKETPND